MKLPKRIINYVKENITEVLHTTLNPEGPGVVRIHMVPPNITEDDVSAAVVILNGQDIIPINVSWMVLLAEFIKEINKYSGKPISEDEYEGILNDTCKAVKKVYPLISKKVLKGDIYTILKTFEQVARGHEVDAYIEPISLGEYASNMTAPHRMDLLVSSMAKEGNWHCNQKCIHCYAAGQKLAKEDELDTESWKKIIDKCREAGIPQLTFTGGEPTMREDLVELIKHAGWFVTRLNTNGITLSKEFCKELKEASLDSMQITFYSYDEAIHNKLVGAERYKDTLNGIDNALSEGLNISINTPLCTMNKDYVKTLEFLHERGVIYVTCSGLITTGNAVGDESVSLQLSKEEIKDILAQAIKYCYSNGMEISFTSPGWIEKEFFTQYAISEPNCGACLSNMAITPNGNVVPCQSYLSDESLGDMLKDEWKDIWNGDKCKERRDYSAQMLGECPLRRYE